MKEEKRGLKHHWKRMVKKKGFFPSLYLVVAALLLTGVLMYQNTNRISEPDLDLNFNFQDELWGEDALERDDAAEPVVAPVEKVSLPTLSESDTQIVTKFYEHNGEAADQEEALVFYNNKFYQSEGIDIAAVNDDPLPVVAALSGEVVDVRLDPLLGYVVQVKHDHDLVTYYSSLTDVDVEKGQQLKQGEVLAHAGSNVFSQDLGRHVHFEIRKSGEPINPESYLDQPVTQITEEDVEVGAELTPPVERNQENQQLESSISSTKT